MNSFGFRHEPRAHARGAGCFFALVLLALAPGCQREEIQVYNIEKESRSSETRPNPHAGQGHGVLPNRPRLNYRTPAGWTTRPPSTMRVASFAIAGDGEESADVAVIPLPDMGGRDLDMVNLWRGQVRLAPIDAATMEQSRSRVPIGGAEGKFFDMAGPTSPEGEAPALRVMVAILERDGLSWFFKMTGPDALVQAQKTAFLDFLKSMEFPADEPAAPAPAATNAGEGKPTWTVPAGWEEVPGGAFLVAKFNLTGESGATAAVNVSTSPGDGGGWLDNVNRWRGQVGLSSQSAAEINAATRALAVAGTQAQMIEMLGTDARTEQPARVLGVMVPLPDRAWFYKLMGDPQLVEAQRARFTQFVQSVKY